MIRRKNVFSNIEIQGFQIKPSFIKHLVEAMKAEKFTHLIVLSMPNCAIQDTEG